MAHAFLHDILGNSRRNVLSVRSFLPLTGSSIDFLPGATLFIFDGVNLKASVNSIILRIGERKMRLC